MRSDIYWIDWPLAGRLAIMARPRSGDWLADEIAGWSGAEIDAVVSLLEGEEIDTLGLRDEAALCRSHRIDYIGFPIRDRGVPPAGEAGKLSQMLASRIAGGASVAIHCRAGIGRSSVIAACVLIRLGCDPRIVFDLITQARRTQVPDTDEQKEWVIAHGSALRAT